MVTLRKELIWIEFSEVTDVYEYARANNLIVIEMKYFDTGPVKARFK